MISVRAFIPHYFKELEEASGYGSERQGARTARSVALARCLSGLLDLQRGRINVELHIGDKTIDHLPVSTTQHPPESLSVDITVCTDGEHRIEEVLNLYKGRIRCVDVKLNDPKSLALKTRDMLLNDPLPSDLSIYLEDDLVISDREYFDKLLWFATQTNHDMILMPHRYEHIGSNGLGIMLVDGPLAPKFINQFTKPQKNIAKGKYRGDKEISFDIAANPHSGSFALSKQQRERLNGLEMPTSGFVGPLETAATLTALKYFPIIKTSAENMDFLLIEHGHPSFGGYVKSLPHRKSLVH